MQVIPRKGYVLVSKQDIVEEKKPGTLILVEDVKKKTYLRLESDGESYNEGDCVFSQPFSPKLEIEENLFLMEEKDIVAQLLLGRDYVMKGCHG